MKRAVFLMFIISLFYPAAAESVYQNIRIENFLAASSLGSFFKISSLFFVSVWCVHECVLILVCVWRLEGGFECPLVTVHLIPLRKGSLNLELTFHLAWKSASQSVVLLSPCSSHSSGAGVRGIHRTLPSLLYGCWDQQLSSL